MFWQPQNYPYAAKKMMNVKTIVVAPVATLFVLVGCTNQSQRAMLNGAPAVVQAAGNPVSKEPKILTKEHTYLLLFIDVPRGDAFLQEFSPQYDAKAKQIETEIARISDRDLQEQARKDEW